MASKRKKLRLENLENEGNVTKTVSLIDPTVRKNCHLEYRCGFCDQQLGDDAQEHEEHMRSHKEVITFCNACCIFVRHEEKDEHLNKFHKNNTAKVNFDLSAKLIELKIPLAKCYSNFWGVLATDSDSFHTAYRRQLRLTLDRHRNGRYLGVFRFFDSMPAWNCPICQENPQIMFKETITLRAHVLNHFEQFHRPQIEEMVPGFLDFEWHQLAEETDFDVKALMSVANHRLKIKERGFRTFYTLNLSRLTNGAHFEAELIRRMGITEENVRFCLVCCCLVPEEQLKNHFQRNSHRHFKAVTNGTAFIHIDKDDLDKKLKLQDENHEEPNEVQFRFPEDLFEYTTIYKNVRTDVFKWRCFLCPRTRAHVFTTPVVMRMYALRHIDQHHKFLFTEEFLGYEWANLKQEMRADCDLRKFTPMEYTVKGKDTFDKCDPNDYTLPQQYYFLPKHSIEDTLICGFCYRSLERKDFLRHVAAHGFENDSTTFYKLKKVTQTEDLMGQARYNAPELDDEPHNVLSIEGKRLKSKIEMINERCASSQGYSSNSTPIGTPRRRNAALEARKTVAEASRVLQENLRNLNSTWDESSSSSSDESDSEDERFEKTMKKQAKLNSPEEKPKFSKMNPGEIRKMIEEAAKRKGVKLKTLDSESSSDSGDSEDSEGHVDSERKTKKWESMKLTDIKEAIRNEAKRKKIMIRDSSSDSDSD